MSHDAHTAMFDELKDTESERIDLVLLVVDEEDRACAYVTLKELDRDNIYWQYGGVFGAFRNKGLIYQAMEQVIRWCGERYRRVGFRVENTNYAMLRIAAKFEIPIMGIRNFRGHIMVEHLLDFEEEQNGIR